MNKLINGQNILDKIVTAKHTITRQDVAKAVLKATKDDITVPKRKHIDYLVMCTDNPNINILEMTKLLLDRAHSLHWIISFKALLTIHHIMNYGSSVFLRHMASNNFTLKFGNFSDTSNAVALCMSKFVRTYANYINSKATSFRILGLDLCKVKKGNDDSYFRKLDARKLLESLFRLQSQIEDLLAFGAFPGGPSNILMNSAHLLLAKDMVRLYACYKDAVTNLVGTFLDQDKKFCKEALPIYKKFLDHVDKIHEFLEFSEDAGMSRFDIPRKFEVSPDLLEVFENHLKSFESVKKSSANTPVALPRPEERTLPAKRHSDFLERKTSASTDHEFGTGNQLQNKAKELFGGDENQWDAFNQRMMSEEFRSFSEIDSQFSKNRPASLYSAPKVTYFPESFCDSGNASNLFITPEMNQATAPPGFTGSGEMLQPTKLYSPPTPTLDFSKMSLSPHCNSHLGSPILLPYNNLQNPSTKIIPGVPINGANISSPSYSHMIYPGQLNQPQLQRSGNPFL